MKVLCGGRGDRRGFREYITKRCVLVSMIIYVFVSVCVCVNGVRPKITSATVVTPPLLSPTLPLKKQVSTQTHSHYWSVIRSPFHILVLQCVLVLCAVILFDYSWCFGCSGGIPRNQKKRPEKSL